jgi:hypothetical protein
MNQSSDVSKIPLDVDINCDPVAENVWGFKKQADGTSVAEQQLVSNTGFHFSGGVASLHQNQYSDQNSPQYTYITEGGNLIELRDAGNDTASNAPINAVYLDGKFLDYVPKNGLESIQAIGGQYDDMILTDVNPIGMKVLVNQTAVITAQTGGTSWSSGGNALAASNTWVKISYGNGYFVGITASGQISARSSDLGVTWSSGGITPATLDIWSCMSYGNGVFVLNANISSGPGNITARSTDNGLTWSYGGILPASMPIISSTYGNGTFVAISYNSNLTSRSTNDGVTWSAGGNAPSVPALGWRSSAYGNGVIVAIGYQSTSTMRSTNDGVTWSAGGNAPSAANWDSVTYGDGVFVAVSNTSTMRSTDGGITWSSGGAPPSNNPWSSVSYGNSVFVAISNGSSSNLTMRSINAGVTWSAGGNAPSLAQWQCMAYGNGVFVSMTYANYLTMRSIATYSSTSTLSVRLDEITSTGSVGTTVSVTLTGAGYALPSCLVRQALTTTAGFSISSTQFILACDTYTNATTFTYNIFDQTGQKQLTTSIPAGFAGNTPKNLFAAKMVSLGAVATSAVDAGRAGYVVVSLGTAGNQTPSYLITNSAATSVAPFTNTNTAMKASWAVMQSKNGYNRVMLTGQPNDSTVNQTLIANIGYTLFTNAYTNATVPTNAVTATADSTVVVSSSSYAFVDVVHQTDNNHYFSGYAKPTTTYTPFTTQASSINPITGFGRLSLINETDNGGIKPSFEFRLVMSARSSSNGSTPQFISVGQPYSSDNINVAIGTPISPFGEFDPTFGPQIGSYFNTVIWRWNQVYYIAKVSITPIRPIQKITSNIYKINTISPVNVVDVGAKQLLLGSNDYSSNFLLNSGTVGTAAWASSNIGWQSYSKTAGSSIDLGGLIVYNSAAQTVSPLAAFTPSCHQTGNYYNVNFYAGTGVTANTLQVAWRSDGRVLAAQTVASPTSTTLPGLQNQSSGIGSTYISNTTSVPMPLGSRYSGYVIGANSSATSLAFNETYLSSGYQGTTITTEWDGYLLGNSVPLNAVTFSLFNQPYIFDGKSIYKVNLNGVNLSVPLTVLCRADGLSFLTTSQSQAFFSDPFDNSVWVFDGGYSLQKFKRLDGFGAIQNANFSAYDSAVTINTASAMVVLRDGLWISIPKSELMAADANESYMRMYDTVNGTIFGNSFNWWQYQYYASSTVGTSTTNGIRKISSIVPLNYQTGYIGPDSNLRMVLSGITFAVYNEFKTATSLQVTIYGYDQDKAYTNPTRTFNIQPADYVNGGIFRAMIQPVQDRLLAASIKFVCNTGIRLYDLQYHWTEEAQANISPARSL